MMTHDFSPLFRHSVGFDRMQRLLKSASDWDSNAQSYPPYNIEHISEDQYRITLAVAGFSEQDLDITMKENTLTVSGRLATEGEQENIAYLHHGIAGRAFTRRFEIADHIRVTGADLTNGLLNIDLVREIPEEKKAQQIPITTSSVANQSAA